MRLILSTRDFMEEAPRKVILEHLPAPVEDCRVLFIPGEHATPENLREDMYFRRMRQKGFRKGNIFVFDHTRARDFFSLQLDVIYIGGCNTFLMLQKLRETGYDAILKREVRRGAVYIGGSAGAHVASQSTAHLTRYDALPDGFEDFSGLCLFPGIFVCHYGPQRQAHYEELKETASWPVYALRDADSVVWEDGITTFYGAEPQEGRDETVGK